MPAAGWPPLQKLLLLPAGDLGVAERTRASAPHPFQTPLKRTSEPASAAAGAERLEKKFGPFFQLIARTDPNTPNKGD